MDCETFIDVFVLFCIIAALVCYLFVKKTNYKWFPGQTTTVRGFGTQGNPTNPANLGLAASNFSGGGVVLLLNPTQVSLIGESQHHTIANEN